MRKKYFVKLSEKERKYAQHIIADAKYSNNHKKRANVLLMRDEEAGSPATQEEIAKRCGVSDVTVYHTVRDYCECGIEYALRAKSSSKPPRPTIVDGESEARIYCFSLQRGASRIFSLDNTPTYKKDRRITDCSQHKP